MKKEEIVYTITESAFDELIDLLERIESDAENLSKQCRKRTILHTCEIRQWAFSFRDKSRNCIEYICDQIADQVQYTLTEKGVNNNAE